MKRLSRGLFWVARSWVGAWVIGWSFAHLSHWLPLDVVYETEKAIAFHHPRPSYRTHILIVPKQAVRSLVDLADTAVFTDILHITQTLVHQLDLEPDGYRLIVNGGAYQDVAQVHWHLVADGNS